MRGIAVFGIPFAITFASAVSSGAWLSLGRFRPGASPPAPPAPWHSTHMPWKSRLPPSTSALFCAPARAGNAPIAKIRPDQKIVWLEDWQDAGERLAGAHELLENLVRIAESAKAKA